MWAPFDHYYYAIGCAHEQKALRHWGAVDIIKKQLAIVFAMLVGFTTAD